MPPGLNNHPLANARFRPPTSIEIKKSEMHRFELSELGEYKNETGPPSY